MNVVRKKPMQCSRTTQTDKCGGSNQEVEAAKSSRLRQWKLFGVQPPSNAK